MKNGSRKQPAVSRPYIRPWTDDDDDTDDVARCHGDEVARSTDARTQSRRPFNIISSNFTDTCPFTSAAAGMCALYSPHAELFVINYILGRYSSWYMLCSSQHYLGILL